jgi:hypothetical protein
MVFYNVTPSGLAFIDFVSRILPSLWDCSTDLKHLIRSGFTSKTVAGILCSLSDNHPIFSWQYRYR